jgi:hypothetical protein
MKPYVLLVISFCLLLASLSLYAAQDYIKENPELDRLFGNGAAQDREWLNKRLSSMPPDERQRYIQQLIDAALKMEKDAIIVESVFAKYYQGPDDRKGLTVINRLKPAQQFLADAELAQIAELPLNGVLEIVQYGKGGMKGAKTEIRVVLVMQGPVSSPIEFALPAEGSLIIVQTDNGWALIPKEYRRSDKTITISPGRPYTTNVDVDHAGSEVYSWSP